MSSLDKPPIELKRILYPYIKNLFPYQPHQKWFLTYFDKIIKPYVVSLVEDRCFARKNIKGLNEQVAFLQYYYAYLEYESDPIPESLIALINGLDNIRYITNGFENAVFVNIAMRRHGFTMDDFYPGHYQTILKKILEKTLLIVTFEKIQQAVKKDPNKNNRMALQWITNKIHEEPMANQLTGVTSRRLFYPPNLVWYFFNGATRIPLLIQIEWYHLKKMFREMGIWINYLSKHASDYRNSLVIFPLTSLLFCIRVLFLFLLPYRLLRTFANEVYDQVNDALYRMIVACKPNFRSHALSNIIYVVTNVLIYGTLLSILSLPIFPIPLNWLPGYIFSSYLALIPLSYLAAIPLLSVCKQVYDKEFRKLVPKESKKQQGKSAPTTSHQDPIQSASQPLLFQYRNRVSRSDTKMKAEQADKVNELPLFENGKKCR